MATPPSRSAQRWRCSSASLSVPATAAAAEIHVLLGVDPADASGDVLLSASLAPAQSLTRATGSRTTITQTRPWPR